MRLLPVAALGLLALVSCARVGHDAKAAAPALLDGEGVVLSFSQRVSTWVTIRSTPESRTNGWKERLTQPVLVVYDSRGFNPVFTNRSRLRVEWIDRERVVRIDETPSEGRYVSPTQEVTAALLVPEGLSTGLRVGDQVLVVGRRP